MPTSGTNEPIHAVSDVINQVNRVLDKEFLPLWVTGEISNLSTNHHWYFNLVDRNASLSCVIWKSDARRILFKVANGSKVNVRGKLSIYRERGQFQIHVDRMELAGEGALRAEFERLKLDLEREGLFHPRHKKPIPDFPRRVALLTAQSGAALTDVIKNFSRRYPMTELVHVPTLVQGRNAPDAITHAFRSVMQSGVDVDVVLLTRGGGSFEDLNAFNDEGVARAIFACPIPVVSAIGHERDFTIADFVADRRASTPSTAVELLTPDQSELRSKVAGMKRHLANTVMSALDVRRRHAATLAASLRKPSQEIELKTRDVLRLQEKLRNELNLRLRYRLQAVHVLRSRLERATPRRRIDASYVRLSNLDHRLQLSNPVTHLSELEGRQQEAQRRLRELVAAQITQHDSRVSSFDQRLRRESPLATINQHLGSTERIQSALTQSINLAIGRRDSVLREHSNTLRAVSPLATLERGYAVVTKPDGTKWGEIVSNVDAVHVGETINAHVHGGTIRARVELTALRENSDNSNTDAA